MAANDEMAEFVGMLTDHQVELQAFILSSLGNYSDTLDVLQQTNIVLWKKASQFRPGAPFLPWALSIAKYEILTFMRARGRDRLVFRSEVVDLMVDMAMERAEGFSTRSEVLRDCIKDLSEKSREFLRIRYAQEQSVKQISEKTGRSVDAVKQLYHRIRHSLAQCIDRKLAAETR